MGRKADAYYGNDDEWDEDFPHDDVDLEEPLGYLEVAETFATTDMEHTSSDLKKRSTQFHGRQEVDGSNEISTRILSSGWSGCFRRFAIIHTRASSGTEASSKGKGTSPSESRCCGKGKGKGKPDSRLLSPAKSRQTSSGPMRRGVAHRPRAQVKSGQLLVVSPDGSLRARLSKSKIT